MRPTLLPFLFLPVLALSVGGASVETNGTTLSDLFWQLGDADITYKHVDIGGQNLTTCCLKAVQDSIEIGPSGHLQFRPNHDKWITFAEGDDQPLDLLRNYAGRGQFPCGATYNGDPRGAPVVKVNYTWLADNCRGWQVSSKDNLNAWLQPLSGFLVPAVIFCLSVPRRRRLEVPRALFSPNQAGIKSYPFVPFGAALAMIMVCIDTVFWLCVCFAFSGPMIISGLYEAMLDNAVLEYLRLKTKENRLTIDMRCRCLMVILIGNLDISWNTDDPSGNGGFVDGSPHAGIDYGLAYGDTGVYGAPDENHGGGVDGSSQIPFSGSYGNVPLLPLNPEYATVPEDNQSTAIPVAEGATYAPYSSDLNYRYTTGLTPQPYPMPQAAGSPTPTGASLSPTAMNAAVVPSSPLASSPPMPPIATPVHIIPPSTSPSPTSDRQMYEPTSTQSHLYAGVTHGYPPAPTSVEPGTYGAGYGGAASVGQPEQQYSVLPPNNQSVSQAGAGAVEAGKKPVASPWKHMEQFLYDIRLYDDDFPNRLHSPRQYGKHQGCPCGSSCHYNGYRERPRTRTRRIERKIMKTKKRLQAMLLCQYSFGSMIGAPVVFFLGGFIFAFVQSLESLGNEDIAIGLAFGQWYMTIPHIALVSGLLLAGNNPHILEGVLADDGEYLQDDIKVYGLTYGLSYPSCYKVASLWDRGYNKKKACPAFWLKTLVDTYGVRRDFVCDKISRDRDIMDLLEHTTLSLADWGFLLILTFTLLGVPFLLAFLTAYFTPEIGLSCRSLTFTIYLAVQICQIILWLWAYADPLRLKNNRFGLFLIQRGFFRPHSWDWLVDRGDIVPRNPFKIFVLIVTNRKRVRKHMWQFVWCSIYFVSQWTLGIIGIMAAIGGTLLSLIGVYTANVCTVTTRYWFMEEARRPQVVVSSNSADMIAYARQLWKPCAITAIVFMSVVTFFGWWYQRRMRDMFTSQVKRIDENEREDTRQSREEGGRPPPGPRAAMTEDQLRMSMPTAIIPPPTAPGSMYPPVQGYHHQQQSPRQPSSNLGEYRPVSPGGAGLDAFQPGTYNPDTLGAGTLVPDGSSPPSSAAMLAGDSSGGYSGPSRRIGYSRVPSLQDPSGMGGPHPLE